MKGVVTERIEEFKVGEVKVDGKRWSATTNEKTPLDEGERVKILKINGVKVEVERWEE
jgi:membrane protein implicated in regulation of membrane protease activity